MFNRKSLAFLETLMRTASPSGYEAEAAQTFRDYLSDCCDVRCDVMGNTIAALNPDAPMRVMLDGHYDEIGFQIVYISDEGLLYFRNNGGIDKLNVPSSEVDILTARGRVPGVIGKKPIHLLSADERNKAMELKEMCLVKPKNKAALIVMPERETPGIIAKACAQPIKSIIKSVGILPVL